MYKVSLIVNAHSAAEQSPGSIHGSVISSVAWIWKRTEKCVCVYPCSLQKVKMHQGAQQPAPVGHVRPAQRPHPEEAPAPWATSAG